MNRIEDALQIAVAQYLDASRPSDADWLWFHVPNGEARDKRTGAKLKRMGVKPGVADIIVIGRARTPMAIELKAPKGRLSRAQRWFGDDWIAARGFYVVCRSVAEVAAALDAQGYELRARVAA